MNKTARLITLIVGLVLILTSVVSLMVLNLPTFGGKTVSFKSTYKDKDVTLKGTYWHVDNAEYAVLVCPGYSCDRQKWRPMADLFVKNGCSTLIFDYSGQGASSGTIGFDNAKTDAIPIQIAAAIEELHTLSGIDYDHIILMGHSMGGRSILRLLYDYNSADAETTIIRREITNVILFSPEVNYHFNAQASLFAGTSDAEEEPWKSFDETCISKKDSPLSTEKPTNVYLFGSTHDDIVSDEDVLAIYKHIGGTNVPTSGKYEASEITSRGSKITVGVTSGVLHSYMMYSPKFAAFANNSLQSITGKAPTFNASSMALVYVGWFTALAGILLSLLALNANRVWTVEDSVPTLTSPKSFLLRKLLLWLPATLVAFLVCSFCVAMPFGSPVMNTPYMCFIAGYGLTMLFFYRKGTFKGTEGKLPRVNFKSIANIKDILTGVGMAVGFSFFVWFVLRATMYRLVPLNFRWFWLLFATGLMAVGYYISGVEGDMLDNAHASVQVRVLYNLIQYVPLFLLILFYLVLKSYSGMIGQMQNTLLMYIFCIPLGNLVRKLLRNRVWGAVITAFLFQALMITSAALISMF